MKAAEVQKNKIEHTLKTLNSLLDKCQERIDKSIQELEDIETVEVGSGIVKSFAGETAKLRIHSLQVNIAKDEHMKFYLKEEIDRLDDVHTSIAVGLAEEEEKSIKS